MQGRATDHANLDLRKLHENVVFGRSGGKIIWQPRILAWFSEREFHGEPLPERYRGMSQPEVFRDLQCSNRNYDFNSCFGRTFESGYGERWESISATKSKYTLYTPAGEVYAIHESTPTSLAQITRKWLIETPEDMKIYMQVMEHSGWRFDSSEYARHDAAWGDRGAPTIFMPRVSVQNLYIETMGVERGVHALYEWDEVIGDYFRALHENHMKLIDVINSTNINIINFGDNIHSATCSPRLFEKHVLPYYLERCKKLHAGGKWVCSHWDGDVKPLLKYARICGLDGIEAITPKPQGDVTLEEVKDALGDEVFLLDGLPAVYFDEIFSEQELAECTEKLIKLFAPKLILGISDEISPTGDLERVRLVGKIVDDYNALK